MQTHPDRQFLADELAASIGGDVAIVTDPDPDNPIRSPWRTFREVLSGWPDGTTHVAQIQDDALVCDRYRDAVERAAAAHPDRILVFYVGGNAYMHSQALREACRNDRTTVELGFGFWVPVVATCWPVDLACECVCWNDEQGFPEKFVSDDERAGRFVREYQVRPLATIPSLAEHPDMTESLIGRRARHGGDPNRLAVCWIGQGCPDDVDALDFTLPPWT